MRFQDLQRVDVFSTQLATVSDALPKVPDTLPSKFLATVPDTLPSSNTRGPRCPRRFQDSQRVGANGGAQRASSRVCSSHTEVLSLKLKVAMNCNTWTVPRPNTWTVPRPNTWTVPRPNTWTVPPPTTWTVPHPNTWTVPHPTTWTVPRPNTWTVPRPTTWTLPHPNTWTVVQPTLPAAEPTGRQVPLEPTTASYPNEVKSREQSLEKTL